MPLQGTWTLLSSDTYLKRSSQVLGIAHEKVLLYSGELKPREPVGTDIYACDLQGEDEIASYSTTEETPCPRIGAAGATIGAALFVFSGRGGPDLAPLEENGSLHRFDILTKTWTIINPIKGSPQGRSYHALTSDGHARLYLHAGCGRDGRLNDMWSFSIEDQTWKQLADAPGAPRGGTSIDYHDGKIYRMNGFDGQQEIGGSMDIYDIATDSWTAHPYAADNVQGPEARSVAALHAFKLNKKTYLLTLFGERDPSNLGHAGAGKMLSDTWLYDMQTESWQTLNPTSSIERLPEARGWFASASIVKHNEVKLLLSGGLSEQNDRIADLWTLTITSS